MKNENDELFKPFLSDADFIKAIESDFKSNPTVISESDARRIENRLNSAKTGDGLRRKNYRLPMAYGLVATAASIFLMVFLRHPDSDSANEFTKSASRSDVIAFEATRSSNQEIFIKLTSEIAPSLAFAIVSEEIPMKVLWVGLGEEWRNPLVVASGTVKQICLVAGDNILHLKRKLEIAQEMKEAPRDLNCVTIVP
ncbi:MAG: hypothetical protein EOP04_06220 [Proteobacteria bacterium]|nr:MAG: hypothetical protein EOP04_06220 [Pseudomonadota bacterium]